MQHTARLYVILRGIIQKEQPHVQIESKHVGASCMTFI